MNGSVLTTGDAASLLGVNQSRVRAMIEAGQLEATKVGGQWLIDRVSLDRLASRRNLAGATFSPTNAWGILFIASKLEAPWLNASERSRIKGRLREQSLLDLAPRLRSRAQVHRFRCHLSDLKRIEAESALVLSGVNATDEWGIDLIASDAVEAYVQERDLKKLIRKYALKQSSSGNVHLSVPAGIWPFQKKGRVAPHAVVALDLAESSDQRSRRAGRMALESLS